MYRNYIFLLNIRERGWLRGQEYLKFIANRFVETPCNFYWLAFGSEDLVIEHEDDGSFDWSHRV